MNSPIKLPELPEPRIIYNGEDDLDEEVYDGDQMKEFAKQAVRDALDHAFNELNVLFMETLKARIPGDDLDDNDEKFNIGMCAQALGISRCQHVLRGLNTHSENNHE